MADGRGWTETGPGRPPSSGDALSPASLQRLVAWLSPSFPVGGFSYSHGLEWEIEDGTVTNASGLVAWLDDILRHGAGRSDAILFAHGWRAAEQGDSAALAGVIELAAAFQPTRERALESTSQGRAFLATVSAAWPNDRLAALTATLVPGVDITYPVAVAMAAAANAMPLRPTLVACLNAFTANLVSAGIRAIPIGHTDGQRVLAALLPAIEATAEAGIAGSLDDLGGAAFRADIASMKHETQYTRLFRS